MTDQLELNWETGAQRGSCGLQIERIRIDRDDRCAAAPTKAAALIHTRQGETRMETVGLAFEAIVAICAFGGFGLGCLNYWQAHRRKPPTFEREVYAGEGYWRIQWTIRNNADSAITVEGISSSNAAFVTEDEVPRVEDPYFVLGIPKPAISKFSAARRELRISVQPHSATENPLSTYFGENPRNLEIALHWRWSHESRPLCSRIRM
ncbi:hypothetical protein [Paracoccus methylarcula]|uniref:hypothetical protein n=1 Tax=Paracoccus methylarcula TaxID=72022 RepID=UPI0011CDA1C3|nr:hypothetical protein [Paracoccus methylarcula]